MQAAADARPGTMAAVLGADDDAGGRGLRQGRRRRVGGQHSTAPARSSSPATPTPSPRPGAIAKELGARKVHAAARRRRLPHARSWPRPPTRLRAALAGHHLRRRRRCRSSPTSTPSPTSDADQWADLPRRPAHRPGALAADDRADGGRRRHHLRRARPGLRAHRHGQAHRARRHRRGRGRPRRARRRRRGRHRRPARSTTTTASTSSPPSGSS